MKIKILALVLLGYSLTACETIYFEKGTTKDITTAADSNWHHGGGILGLIEFSDPYNPVQHCDSKKWNAVKVDHSFGSALVSAIIPYGVYTPWEVSVRCIK